MILKNYHAYKKTIDEITSVAFTVREFTGTKRMSDGAVLTGCVYSGNGTALKTLDMAYGVHMNFLLGTGEIAVTPDDWKLEEDVTSSFTNRTFNCTSNLITDSNGRSALEKIYTLTGLNSGESTLTIKEVGIYKYISANSSSDAIPPSDIESQRVLFIRHVLDTPLTISPNNTIKVILTVIDE